MSEYISLGVAYTAQFEVEFLARVRVRVRTSVDLFAWSDLFVYVHFWKGNQDQWLQVDQHWSTHMGLRDQYRSTYRHWSETRNSRGSSNSN